MNIENQTSVDIRNLVTPPAFEFRGGAITFALCKVLGWTVTAISLGLLYPWSVTMQEHWRISNTYVNGKKLKFTGSAFGLFGKWIKWWILSILTLGIYLFFIAPDLQRWLAENTDFEDEV